MILVTTGSRSCLFIVVVVGSPGFGLGFFKVTVLLSTLSISKSCSLLGLTGMGILAPFFNSCWLSCLSILCPTDFVPADLIVPLGKELGGTGLPDFNLLAPIFCNICFI